MHRSLLALNCFCTAFTRLAWLLLLVLLSAAEVPAAAPAGYYVVWADEFNGSALDGTKWYAWNNLNRQAVNLPQAVTVNGGYLTITTHTTNGTHYAAIVSSDGRFRPRYGYLEASIQFQTTPGMWSAFWMQSPTEGQYIGDPSASGAEIDICEHRKSDGQGNLIDSFVQSTVHWDGYAADHKQLNSGNIGSGLGTGFHTYGLLWDRTNYAWLIDGAQQWSATAGHSDRTEVVLLSSEVQDAYWAGVVPPGGYGNFLTSTTKMVVDYVRYYAPTNIVFWTGATSASWDAGANWLQSRVPRSGDEAVVSYLSVGNYNISLGQNTAVGGLSLQEPGPVSINNQTLTINSVGIDMLSAGADATINSRLNLGAAQAWRIAGGRTLTINGVLGGAGNLTLRDRGTVVLMAVNTNTGTATVSNGTLLVSGTTGTNTVRLAGGALSGTGRVAGPVVVSAGGTLAPGLPGAIGTLSLSNTLTVQPGGFVSVEVNKSAGTGDRIIGLTSVTYGGVLVVNNQAGTLAARDAFKLFDSHSYQGAFARISPLSPGANLAWDTSTLTNDGTLRVMSTVRTNVTAQLSPIQSDLSWPADHIGWLLQVQTNPPQVGLTTNWVTVPGSLATNRLVIPVDRSVGSVFYRLASPPFSTSPFTKGDLIVLQVGNGAIGNAGAPGFLNDYSPAGGPCLFQVALPSSGPNAIAFGSSAYGGSLTLSPDGRALVISGYNAAAGSYSGTSIDSSTTAGATPVLRAVGSADASGAFLINATTTQFSGNTIRSAVTDGQGNFWAGGGSGGIVYLGTNSASLTVTSAPAATRNLGIASGNIYFTETGLGRGVMGFIGAPVSPAMPTLLLSTDGIGSGNSSPKGFAFNPALTVGYVADNRAASSGGGIFRFNWTGTAWVYAYTLSCTLSSSQQVWELTADFSGPNTILYATTGETTGNSVVRVTDTGPASAYTILATAPAGSAFRGIAFAPSDG